MKYMMFYFLLQYESTSFLIILFNVLFFLGFFFCFFFRIINTRFSILFRFVSYVLDISCLPSVFRNTSLHLHEICSSKMAFSKMLNFFWILCIYKIDLSNGINRI